MPVAMSNLTWDDSTWILTSSFIIFTMQSGFGLLEAGSVSSKNEVNIMVKNAVDVIFGGISYWAIGHGLSFGQSSNKNSFSGYGDFFINDDGTPEMGVTYSKFIFQLSFATTATTIVSGAMAERTKLSSYMIFSVFNTFIYSIPAHWIWDEIGFLRKLGVIDIAGASCVHLLGGVSALVAAILLGPRLNFKLISKRQHGDNPTNCMIGMFMLWWGWLGVNCGSTFGISGGKWIIAAKSAVTTIMSSIGGGAAGMIMGYIIDKKFYVNNLVTSILSALVSITGICAVVKPWECLIIGAIGACLCQAFAKLLICLQIDDPVNASVVHGVGGIWGMISVGLFASMDPIENITINHSGLFHNGGNLRLLGVQLLACVCVITWSALLTLVVLFIIKHTIGLRMSMEDEILGADFTEHGIERGDDFSGGDADRNVIDNNCTAFGTRIRRRKNDIKENNDVLNNQLNSNNIDNVVDTVS